MTTIPEMTMVASSNVAAIGHDGAAMHVTFKGGGHYVYDGVPAETYQEALASDSIGRFIGRHIKGAFAAKRIS